MSTWRSLVGGVLVATFAGVFLWDSVLTSDSANALVPKSWVLPAEWEPHEAIWMGFRSREAAYDSVTLPMLRALTRHIDVRLVIETDSLIPDGIGFLADEGVDTSRIHVFAQSPTDVWYRDPGPVFLRRGAALAIADFLYSN